MISSGVRIYFSYIFNGELSSTYNQMLEVFIGYSRSLLGITLFLLLYVIFEMLYAKGILKNSQIINVLDTYSYSVYLVHQMFILSPFTCLTLTKSALINCVIALLVIAVVAYIHNFVSDILIRHPKKLEMKA